MTIATAIESMNKAQARSFRKFIDNVIWNDKHEVKELDVTDSYGAAYVDITVGMKNDEGTLAESLCRDTYLFFIGKRGGIFQYVNSHQTYLKAYQVKPLGI